MHLPAAPSYYRAQKYSLHLLCNWIIYMCIHWKSLLKTWKISTYLFHPIQSMNWGASVAAGVLKGAIQNLLHAELCQLRAANRTDGLHGADHTKCPTAPTLKR